jgi:hypothetical protein
MPPYRQAWITGLSGVGAYSALHPSARMGQTVFASNAPSGSATQGVDEKGALKVNFAGTIFNTLG